MNQRWVIPTLGDNGRPNEERVKALGKVLRSAPARNSHDLLTPPL